MSWIGRGILHNRLIVIRLHFTLPESSWKKFTVLTPGTRRLLGRGRGGLRCFRGRIGVASPVYEGGTGHTFTGKSCPVYVILGGPGTPSGARAGKAPRKEARTDVFSRSERPFGGQQPERVRAPCTSKLLGPEVAPSAACGDFALPASPRIGARWTVMPPMSSRCGRSGFILGGPGTLPTFIRRGLQQARTSAGAAQRSEKGQEAQRGRWDLQV